MHMARRRKTDTAPADEAPAEGEAPIFGGEAPAEVKPLIDLGSREIETWSIDRIKPYANNPNTHSKAQIAQIVASMREFGWTIPALVDEGGMLIAGHGRLEAAKQIGLTLIPVIVARGWSNAQKRAYVIADNQIAANSEWNPALLKSELAELKALGFDVTVTGFSDPELAELLKVADDEVADGEEQGRLLELINITIAEPKHEPEHGDHYILSGRHHLLICGVIRDHHRWAPLLTPGTLFAPFPGPFVPFAERVGDDALVMVQPDRYIAGHMLDRYAETHGEDAIAKQEPVGE
jgi:hypothetical protein